jgi:hypothetical protein
MSGTARQGVSCGEARILTYWERIYGWLAIRIGHSGLLDSCTSGQQAVELSKHAQVV